MAAPNPTHTTGTRKPQILRVFMSYTRGDEKIAESVRNTLQTALGIFAEVFIDSSSRSGLSFPDEIKARLDDTDLLVVIESSEARSAFRYNGIELGYFIGVMAREQDFERPRRIVPIFLDTPHGENEGIAIGVPRATLAMPLEEYDAQLIIDSDHPMVRFLAMFQAITDRLREENGFPKVAKQPEEEDLCGLVRNMQLSIFSQLKTRQESTLKPQKQVTIRTCGAGLDSAGRGLPPDAQMIPIGTGNPLAIFGLPDQELSWRDFTSATKNSKFGDSWIDAISNVIASSLQRQMDVDSSQVIVSNDRLHAFRVILTTGTRYFNGIWEFNLCFVETRFEQKVSLRKDYAFIAMAMDVEHPELDHILDAIKAGAMTCNVTAERVDEAHGNERITDRTLDSIACAEFVIVDLTYDRPNVYYEAGYAQALKKTPIYLAKRGTTIHFDVKDYPVIYYSNTRSLKSSLAQRLAAIIAGRANKD